MRLSALPLTASISVHVTTLVPVHGFLGSGSSHSFQRFVGQRRERLPKTDSGRAGTRAQVSNKTEPSLIYSVAHCLSQRSALLIVSTALIARPYSSLWAGNKTRICYSCLANSSVTPLQSVWAEVEEDYGVNLKNPFSDPYCRGAFTRWPLWSLLTLWFYDYGSARWILLFCQWSSVCSFKFLFKTSVLHPLDQWFSFT